MKLFYENRDADNESKLVLIVRRHLGNMRLESHGTEIQEKDTDAEKVAERLHKFQEEMSQFTEFLKGVFFNS